MYQKKARSVKPWIIMACVIAAFIWLLYALGNVLTPFIVAAVLAYVLNPLVEWLQLKRIRRAPASMIIMALALLILLALMLIIIPMLLNQFNNLAERLPQIVGFVQNKLLPWLNSVSGDYIQIDQESIIAWLQSHTDELSNTLKAWIPTLMCQSGNVISGVSNLVLLPLLLYYFLLDWKRWSSG
ncbi:AI-2E family transporter, partial [Neisseria sp. P0021.S007]|uniref:AI-2E family transporter n=1 Tax=Neisseria sp. P0021.S007 TaxID=3436822 RepID=UPI003F7E90B1